MRAEADDGSNHGPLLSAFRDREPAPGPSGPRARPSGSIPSRAGSWRRSRPGRLLRGRAAPGSRRRASRRPTTSRGSIVPSGRSRKTSRRSPVSMTALSGTTRPEPSSTCNSTSPNMSGLSAPPWFATSMRTLTVRVALSTSRGDVRHLAAPCPARLVRAASASPACPAGCCEGRTRRRRPAPRRATGRRFRRRCRRALRACPARRSSRSRSRSPRRAGRTPAGPCPCARVRRCRLR